MPVPDAHPVLDVDFVRAQFPAFASPGLQGQAFFENAGGSYTCQRVIDRLTRFYHDRKVQPYAPYAVSQLGGAEMDEARTRLAALMGVAREEVSFGPSTSANTFVLAQAVRVWLRGTKGAVVVTNQDHESNSGVWRRLAEEGIEVREWRIDPETGHLDPAGLAKLLEDGRVKLVCFPHCSNVVAEINPVADICAMARAAGAYTCVDGVSYAPHGLPDVAGLGADVYLFSAYKTYGPHQGIMVIRAEMGAELPNQAHSFNGGTLYKRFTPAGPDHAQVAASAGMADYIGDLHAHHFGAAAEGVAMGAAVHDLMRDHEVRLLQPLLDYVAGRNDVRLIGPRDAKVRAPTVALALDVAAEPVAAALADHGIMAGGGDFYAVRPLTAMGVDLGRGVLRVSFVHYTSEAEVTKLIGALDAVL
jgi:selenocysteine lyase/cysteine desulfurase